jgi:hypothetical protein
MQARAPPGFRGAATCRRALLVMVAVAQAALGQAAADVSGDVGPNVAPRRGMQSQYPGATASNGTASASFPSSDFATYCAADSACSAAANAASSGLGLSLTYAADATSAASQALGWPSIISGTGVSGQTIVSGMVELQLTSFNAKQVGQLVLRQAPEAAVVSTPLPLRRSCASAPPGRAYLFGCAALRCSADHPAKLQRRGCQQDVRVPAP